MQNLSYGNDSYTSLACKVNSFSHEKLCTGNRFEAEVKDNSEMPYCFDFRLTQSSPSLLPSPGVGTEAEIGTHVT